MSTPARGRGGATIPRGGSSKPRGRASYRGNGSNASSGRGRGRGGAPTSNAPVSNGEGLLQKLRTGSIQNNTGNGAPVNSRGRGASTRGQLNNVGRARGSLSRTFNTPRQPRSTPSPRSSSPAPPTSHRDFMAQMNETFQSLKPKRDAERKKAIQDGFLADPEKKTSLANAITPVGTCTEMCPQFERVERIVQNMVDRAEKVSNTATGRDMPSESRMVKRFRRSAAGYDEQLPSDIRTPETLKRTLDYLLNKVIGGEDRLATIHKFVWDRTRGIRNDFSIQQVTKKEDVKIAVDCYERIARFHILSLHQLSNPDNLQEGEHFDAHQEREQLNNTLLSLMYYYDDHRSNIPLPNEPEFRAYCILFELHALTPDIEDRMQAWPVELLNHPRVQTAFKLYAAAANTIMDQGPLRPLTPFSSAQANSAKFWTILSSQAVPYIMACVAEMNFSMVRFTALDALWRSAKSAPQGQQGRNQDWTLAELQNYLAFDEEEETLEFCQAFDLAFKNSDQGEQCLDFTAVAASALDKSSLPSQQVFSHGLVEEKRYRRTLVAVMNGVSIASAIRQGLVVDSSHDEEEQQHQDDSEDDQSMFIPEQTAESLPQSTFGLGSNLNPAASSFTPSGGFGQPPLVSSNQLSAFGKGFGNNESTGIKPTLFGFGSSAINNGFPTSPLTLDSSSAISQPGSISQQQPALKSIFGQSEVAKPSLTGFPQPESSSTATATSQIPPFESIFGPNKSKPQSPTPGAPTFGLSNTSQGINKDAIQPKPSKVSFESPQIPQSSAPAPFQSIFGQTQQIQQSANSAPFQSLFGQTQPKTPVEGTQVAPAPIPASGINSGFVFNQPKPQRNEQSVQTPGTTPSSISLPSQQTSNEHKTQPGFSFFSTHRQSTTVPSPPVEPLKPLSTTSAPSIRAQAGNADNKAPTLPPLAETQRASDSSKESAPPFKFTPLPSFQASTTPQGTPQKPQSEVSKFVSIADKNDISKTQRSVQAATETPESQVQKSPSPASFKFKPTPSLQSSLPESQVPLPKFTEADHKQLIENTSRLILTQQQGLIEYFVSHHVSNLLQPLVRQWLQKQEDEAINYIRTRHLSRKFSAIWRERTQRNVLNRRAKQRRKLLAAAMVAEQDRKQRDELELEAILLATQETKRIQEQRILHQHKLNASFGQERIVRPQDTEVIGQKRKSASNNSSPHRTSQPVPRNNQTHKRSRTIGTSSEPSKSLRLSTTSNHSHLSSTGLGASRFGQSVLGRSSGSIDWRSSMSRKVDSTKTDYFKLKAMGLDPNTPLIPDTARTLVQRKRRGEEARQALLARSKSRLNGHTTLTASRTPTPAVVSPSTYGSILKTESSSPSKQDIIRPSTIPTSIDEDPFLRQLREARQSLANSVDWIKDQSAALEKEIAEHEDLQRSQLALISHVNTRPQSPQALVNGFANTNGYDYYLSQPKTGKTLSRTEERIRKTGAHGLATKPPNRTYVPVAMSKQSALGYSYGADYATMPAGKKRGRGELNSSPDFEGNPHLDITASPATKRTRENNTVTQDKSNTPFAKLSINAFAALQDHNVAEDDEDEEAYIEDDPGSDYYHQNGANDGDTEDNGTNDDQDLCDEDEEGEEESADEEDDEEEEDTTFHYNDQPYRVTQQYPHLGNLPTEERVYDDDDDDEEADEDDDGTPGTYPAFSRAQSRSSAGVQSGPGASADDALVLSD